jgi:DNA-binding transcriptional regulator YdaS (Cro superfamily)
MKIDHALKYFKNDHGALAEAAGVSPSAISKWKKRGDVVPLKKALILEKASKGKIALRLKDY